MLTKVMTMQRGMGAGSSSCNMFEHRHGCKTAPAASGLSTNAGRLLNQ